MINGQRLWERLMALAEIGALPGGGVNRQALSAGEIEAWRLVCSWAAQAGMEAACDAAGNLFLTLPGRDRDLPPLLCGSHLDTQPTGGKFDGAYGVMAALEAGVSLHERGITPARDFTAVAWMNEEGSRFAPGMMGSEFFAGVRDLETIRAAKDEDGISAGAALDALHAAFPSMAKYTAARPGFYLEAHIEQGPTLEAQNCPIGIVTGIQGKITWEIVISGAEGHAGTLAMARRRDAVAAFARMAEAMHRSVGNADEWVKFTIGAVNVAPNAPSVVPSRVAFRIDLRHSENAMLQKLASVLEEIAAAQAAPCDVAVTRLVDAPSNDFDAGLQGMLRHAALKLGHAAMPILSFAGHDARHLAGVCPSAMLFIPCRDGVSHAEHEWAEPAHVIAGGEVLGRVVEGLLG